MRDQLFRKMIGSVVVGAIGGHGRELVGGTPSTHEVVRGRLTCRVRGIGCIGRVLVKQPLRAKRAKYFIGRDMQEPESGTMLAIETAPVPQCFLEQREG